MNFLPQTSFSPSFSLLSPLQEAILPLTVPKDKSVENLDAIRVTSSFTQSYGGAKLEIEIGIYKQTSLSGRAIESRNKNPMTKDKLENESRGCAHMKVAYINRHHTRHLIDNQWPTKTCYMSRNEHPDRLAPPRVADSFMPTGDASCPWADALIPKAHGTPRNQTGPPKQKPKVEAPNPSKER